MSLEMKIMAEMKDAMKSKNEAVLRGIRAIKAEIIVAKTEPGANGTITEEAELLLLQRMIKQRKDSVEIFSKQDRSDLALKEQEEIDVIIKFLPKQLTEEELELAIKEVIAESGASSMADMGKVMGLATKKLTGKSDGKSISAMVKKLLA